VPTIYPPVAQTVRDHRLPDAVELGTLGVQLGAAACVVATTGLLARFLGDRRGAALLYGACPAVMIGPPMERTWTRSSDLRIRPGLGSGITGTGWRALPRPAAGVSWCRCCCCGFREGRRRRTGLTGLLVLACSYLPHLLTVGNMVVGFLPGYWRGEGYDGARQFALFVWLPEWIGRLPRLRWPSALPCLRCGRVARPYW
jgi:hypothetical protein